MSNLIKNYADLNIIIKKDYIILKTKHKTFKNKNFLSNLDINSWIKDNIKYVNLYSKEEKNKYMDNKIENVELPYMNFAFYSYLTAYKKIPTFEELLKNYKELYLIETKDKNYKVKENIVGCENIIISPNFLKGRIFRSYYSFIREVHLLSIIQSFIPNAYYDFKKDLNGIDICLDDNTGIASFVYTNRSKDFKEKKNSYRHDFSNIKLLDLPAYINPLDPKYNCVSINKINLYNADMVKKEIKKFLKEANL